MIAVAEETLTLTADRGDARRRLDLVLRRHLGRLSTTRTCLQTWIETGRVSVNGRIVCRVAARTAHGDVVTVMLPRPSEGGDTVDDSRTSSGPPLSILYEDEHLLAVDKPAGVVVHPSYRQLVGTLMHGLREHGREWPDGTRPSLVGRLDQFTSGVVVVAKTAAVHAALQRALASSRGAKDYLAVVYGRVRVGHGQVALPLASDPSDRRRVVALEAHDPDGAASLTLYARMARAAAPSTGLALLRCRLVTGRKHQIRVHLAARGWPLVGDAVYGGPLWSQVRDATLSAALKAFPRQALHAWRVAFTHPATGSRLLLVAPVPSDLRSLLRVSGLSYGLDRALTNDGGRAEPSLMPLPRC